MKFEIAVPDDLKPFDINPMFWAEGGLITVVGFRAHLPDDTELLEKYWKVNGTAKAATTAFENEVWPHVRAIFADEIAELAENLKVVQAAEAKKARRAARKQKASEE